MHAYLIAILLFLLFAWALETLAELLNLRSLDRTLPQEFADTFDGSTYATSQAYTQSQAKVEIVSSTVNTALLLGFILLGGFAWLDGWLRGLGFSELVTGLIFFLLIGLAMEVLSLPVQLYRTFSLEERFGFNRTTPATFAADKLKELLLSLIIGLPVMAGLLLFFQRFPATGWLMAWGFIVLIMLIIQYVAPIWILPLFNRFTPLPEGSVRDKIEELASRTGFQLKGVYVMDGSKRSSKSNAFFTGLGKKKRIALFDTLMDKHDPDELQAVLAHEVGHAKLGHVVKNLILGIAKMGLLLFLVSLAISHQPLFEAFSVQQPSVYLGLVFFALLYTPVSMLISLAMNSVSRRFEYQADRFAAGTVGDPEPLIRALKKLARDNLSNLTPHALYVALHYSHPPLKQRIASLKSQSPS
jgi:STE24 endopeptidase